MKIIGLGKAGCNITKAFSKFPQYETFSIDTSKDADITIKKRKSHEEYDSHFPNLKRKFRFSNDEVYVVVSGAGMISGGILRLLEQIKKNNINADLSIPIKAYYNKPWTLPFLKRNELLFRVN